MADNGEKNPDDVCRDYLKNICNRGARCKFYHPPDAVPTENSTEVHFCIDYQNRGCMRDNCRFVHVSREEAERYKMTKEVNLTLARAIAAVGNTGDQINGIPVCKEFQAGKCSRGAARCRYWHVNVEEEKERRRRGLPPSSSPMGAPRGAGGPPGGGRGGGRGDFGGPPGYGGGYPDAGPMGGPPYGMRRPMPPDFDQGYPDMKRSRMDDQRLVELEKRNLELQKEVEGLRRELQREKERYEDLYALFRQQTSGGAPPPPPRVAGSASAPYQNSGAPGGMQQWGAAAQWSS